MIYQKIWFDGTTIRLRFLEQLEGAKDAHEFECAEAPTGAFKGSLAAFAPFVVNLLELPLEWSDCDVRSLSLKREEKSNARGLQVTVMRKIAEAKNRPVTITTPYLSEPPADYTGDGNGYLDDVTIKLIEEAERQAELYRTGERGEQMKLELSDNIKQVEERMAAAEVASTRKPRSKKRGAAFVPGVGDVANPDATEPVTDDALRQLLLTVDRDVPIDAIARWTSSEREMARRWAERELRRRVEFSHGKAVSPVMEAEPECVEKSATLPLKADEWTAPAPVRVNDEAAQEIAASVEHGD